MAGDLQHHSLRTDARPLTQADVEAIVVAAPVLIWSASVSGGHEWLSSSWVLFTGIPECELAGMGWTRTVHSEDLERCVGIQATSFEAAHSYSLDVRLRRRDGEYRWMFENGVPRRGSAGETIGFVGTLVDIHERKLLEEALAGRAQQLRLAERRQGQFLAMLSHELRNPLAPIRNAVQIMQLSRDEAMNENARKIIERQLKQMVHLVDDLLDVSRISQGKVELRLGQVDVADAVLDAIETSRPLIDAGRHHLTTKLAPPGALMVEADATRVTQIVANLLNNAAKYTPEGGHIQVLAERDGDEAVITVQDSGIGLTQDMLARVFEMFAQVDRSMERAQGGLGIGLALVKRLVEMHGGTVAATSDGPDRGCRFVVRLPLIRVPVLPRKDRGHELAAEDTEGLRVLVVDDNVDSAESLSQLMRILGYPVAVAHDGVEAVETAATWRPAVVLMDIGMPRMSGLEAALRCAPSPAASASG